MKFLWLTLLTILEPAPGSALCGVSKFSFVSLTYLSPIVLTRTKVIKEEAPDPGKGSDQP